MDEISKQMERTFIMIKPDGIERGLVGETIQRFEKKGFQIIACQMLTPTRQLLEKHYIQLKKKDFFLELIKFMLSGPVMAMVWQGKGIVAYARKILGETDPLACALGTIRGDLGVDIGRNICHASDSLKSAKKEIALWFPKNKGIINYQRKFIDKLFYESQTNLCQLKKQ
jgi:nucleoside-diphosphate kinase